MTKTIYDFGSNNGDDIPYYLKKADRVIAVEANTNLCKFISDRFEDAIRADRLKVINVVLSKNDNDDMVKFYLHKTNHVLSQFPRPNILYAGDFVEVDLPARTPASIVKEFGHPHFVKIDVENYDQYILENLFEAGIRPELISAESHSIEVFASLVALGKYKFFKIVDGHSVASKFQDHLIRTSAGFERYSFPHHSAGPFGEDIPGNWLNANELFNILASVKLGWKDIHAALKPSSITDYPVDAGSSAAEKLGRNSLCPCGSGKRYKHCHGTML